MMARQQLSPPERTFGTGSIDVAHRPLAKVCAVIVTYNGGSQISKTVAAIIDQVECLLIVDNHSDAETKRVLAELQASYPSRFRLVLNQANRGIAAALNQGVEFAKDNACEWLMTLDQDTVLEKGAIAAMLAESRPSLDGSQIAIIAPQYIFLSDVQPEKTRARPAPRMLETKMIHTSGNLVRMSVFEVVGPFREDFFIDQVDYEFCFRLRHAGFKIVLNPKAVAYHRPGDLKGRTFFSKHLFITNYSALRRYYIARNGIVVARDNRSWSFLKDHLTLVFKESLKVLLYEDAKAEKVLLTVRGLADGVRNKLGKIAYKERA